VGREKKKKKKKKESRRKKSRKELKTLIKRLMNVFSFCEGTKSSLTI